MSRTSLRINMMSAVAAALILAFSSPASADDDFGGLPEGEGRETVFYSCQACHSLMTVTNQRFSRRVWDEILDWMVDDHGMAELPDDEREVVLDYLVTHMGIEN